jgi:hypothetical protein
MTAVDGKYGGRDETGGSYGDLLTRHAGASSARTTPLPADL